MAQKQEVLNWNAEDWGQEKPESYLHHWGIGNDLPSFSYQVFGVLIKALIKAAKKDIDYIITFLTF